MGKDIPLNGIFDEDYPRYGEAGDLRNLYNTEAEVKQIIDTAKGIEGLIRQPGVHAAGVIMSAEPLTDHIPVWTRHTDGAVITQFDYPTCEGLGLLKMDFLGLRNLTIMADAVRAIEDNRKIKIDLLSLPLTDKPTYELLSRGDTLGVFQFDSSRLPDPAAHDEAGQLRGHLRPRRALPPRPDGRQQPHQLRAAQERPAGDHPDPPRARRAAEGDPPAHLRPDRLPGAGAARGADPGRLHARTGRPAAPRDGQEEEGDPGQGVHPVPRRAAGSAATPTRRSRRSGTSWSRSPATRSTRRTPPPTAWSPTGPPTSRRTTRPSSWPPSSPASATTRTSPRSTCRSPAGWA